MDGNLRNILYESTNNEKTGKKTKEKTTRKMDSNAENWMILGIFLVFLLSLFNPLKMLDMIFPRLQLYDSRLLETLLGVSLFIVLLIIVLVNVSMKLM